MRHLALTVCPPAGYRRLTNLAEEFARQRLTAAVSGPGAVEDRGDRLGAGRHDRGAATS
jgi:hypothetical protein